jgi:hypothetical protein
MGNYQWELVKPSAAFSAAQRSFIREILGFQIGLELPRGGGGASLNCLGVAVAQA